MAKSINEKREIELSWVWWNKVYSLLTMNFQFSGFDFRLFLRLADWAFTSFIIPAVTMCVTFSVYVGLLFFTMMQLTPLQAVIMKKTLDGSVSCSVTRPTAE